MDTFSLRHGNLHRVLFVALRSHVAKGRVQPTSVVERPQALEDGATGISPGSVPPGAYSIGPAGAKFARAITF